MAAWIYWLNGGDRVINRTFTLGYFIDGVLVVMTTEGLREKKNHILCYSIVIYVLWNH